MNTRNGGICLIRCDAAPSIGFGHAIRCLAVADELRERHGMQVEFAMINGRLGIEQVASNGYKVHHPEQEELSVDNEGEWLQAVVRETQPRILVLDVRTAFEPQVVRAIREQGVYTATIDDPSERRLVVDSAFYPPVPQVEKLDWSAFDGELRVGWEWVPLKPEFTMARTRRHSRDETQSGPPKILVTMGGSDPAGLTLLGLRALDQLDEDFNVDVILGGGFIYETSLKDWMQSAKRVYKISKNVRDLSELMISADLALISFGVTAFETATIGVPSIHICLTEDHAESSRAFSEVGMATSLGYYINVSTDTIASSVQALLQDPIKRKRMSMEAINYIDGRGARNIAEDLVNGRYGYLK